MNLRNALAISMLAILGFTCTSSSASAAPMVSDPNLLSGLAANPANINVSSIFDATNYAPQFATNGTGNGAGKDFVFAMNDPDERLAITGFRAQLTDIRVWTASDLAPSQITIYDST